MSEKRQPWMKFYPADWRADPRLRVCSLTARGLWMDMLALMHEATPYGHLLVNGMKPTAKQLAALIGSIVGIVTKALAELEAAGVFSKTEQGVIYSRRMVRDNERSQEGREWIKKRWPSRAGGSPPNRVATAKPITQKPDARYQTQEYHDSKNHDVAARETTTEHEQVPEADEPSRKLRMTSGGKGPRHIASVFNTGKRLKRQDLADAHMRQHLQRHASMTLAHAEETVDAARDPTHPDHANARKLCELHSKDHKLGWFANDRDAA